MQNSKKSRIQEKRKTNSVPHLRFSGLPVAHGGIKKNLRVRDLKGNRTVAMARLLKEGGCENTARFLREARLTGSLQHPNIIPVYDIGFDEQQRPFFTMELLKGENLSSVIGRITFSDAQYEKKYIEFI